MLDVAIVGVATFLVGTDVPVTSVTYVEVSSIQTLVYI